MSFRFRKINKLFPGVKLNLSKSGISTSVGVPGATVNIGKNGTRTTAGLPGTGINYSEKVSGPSANDVHQQSLATTKEEGDGTWFLWLIAAVAVGMVIYRLVTSR